MICGSDFCRSGKENLRGHRSANIRRVIIDSSHTLRSVFPASTVPDCSRLLATHVRVLARHFRIPSSSSGGLLSVRSSKTHVPPNSLSSLNERGACHTWSSELFLDFAVSLLAATTPTETNRQSCHGRPKRKTTPNPYLKVPPHPGSLSSIS